MNKVYNNFDSIVNSFRNFFRNFSNSKLLFTADLTSKNSESYFFAFISLILSGSPMDNSNNGFRSSF